MWNVLYVPMIAKNIVSVIQMVDQGTQIGFNQHGNFLDSDEGWLSTSGCKDERMFILETNDVCKDCRAEANVKTESREKECAGLMGAWSHAQYAGEGERECEREKHRKKL